MNVLLTKFFPESEEIGLAGAHPVDPSSLESKLKSNSGNLRALQGEMYKNV